MTDLVPIRLKRFCLSCAVTALLLSPATAPAELRGPYTNDVNTLYLFHFNEAVGGSVTANAGSKGGSCYTVTNETTGNGLAAPPPVTTMLGYASYPGFGNAVSGTNTDGLANGLVGFDGNNSGAYDADVQGGPASPDAIAHTNLNIGNGGVTPFTLEALIRPIVINANQEIICTDDYNGSRGFQFKITSAGQLQFQFITGGLNLSVAIPSSGTHAFVANTWYHVAATYDGAAVKLYWTRLDSSMTAANQISTANWTVGAAIGAVVAPFVIAAENRGSAQESFRGLIDEVRISSVARGSGEMQFFSPTVTISQDPASQNIDYGQPVTFAVSASSLTSLGYQWRHGGTPIPGSAATNSSYTIASVVPADGGTYDCVVTNTSGNSATSHVANLVVGAPNFLAHRYSFTADTSDSVGGAWGTNSGTATVANGALVLDGTTETFMQLPGGLLNGLSAVTVEFWVTNGVNGDNCRIFDFGNTNGVLLGVAGQPAGYVFFSPHAGANHRLTLTGGGPEFEQTVTPAGTFDERAVHVACVVDPPTHNLAIYTNGVLEAVNTNLATSLASLVNLISYVGRSLYPADAYLNGSIDELRIYNGALSPSSIMLNHVLGVTNLASDGPVTIMQDPANLTCAAGQTATFSAVADGRQPIAYQWYKNGLPILDGTNASVSFTTVLGDNSASIQVLATNNVGATVYNDSSGTANLTVLVAAQLAWIGASSGDWDTATANWTNGAAFVPFSQFDGAVFDNRGSGQPNVNLTTNVNVTFLSVNSSSDYLLTSYAQNGSLSGQATLLKQGSGKFTIDVANNCTGPNIIQGGTLQVGNGSTAGSLNNGPITNNATLSFNRSDAIGVATAIHGTGTLTFDGSGAVALQGSNDYSGSTLINLGTVNLRNSSGLGATSVGTTVSSGQLFIDANVDVSGEALTLNASGPDGSGALRKGGAGATAYNAPITLASDATIGVDGGSTLTLTNSGGINGANVNLTIAGAGNTVIGATVSLGAGVLTKTGNGTLTLNAANNYSGGTALSGGVIAVNTNRALGTGTITCDAAGRVVFATGMTFTNAIVANVVAPGVGTGFLMVGNNTSNTVTTLSGPITLNASVTSGGHFAGPTSSGYLSVIQPLVMPDGTILNVRLGNVRFSGGGYYQEIQIGANTTSIGANNGIATNAIMDAGGNGSATVPTLFDLNGFNQTLAGLRNLVAPANVGWVTNSGATPATLTLNLGDGNAWSFEGGIVGNVSLTLNSGAQTLGTNGAAISGRFTYSGNTLINGGTLTLGLGVGLPNTPAINIASGATLDVAAGGLSVGAGQTLKGNNAFNVSGSLTNLGTIELKLNKSGSSRTNDNIKGLGHIQFGGTLKLNITASPALTTSDSFKLFYASSYGGAFASFDPPAPGSGFAWDTNTLATDGILRIAVGTVQQPVTISAVSVSGGNVTFGGSNAPASGSYVILSSTNVAAPLTSWTHEVTNPWPGTASFSITNPVISGAPQRFYRLQSQ